MCQIRRSKSTADEARVRRRDLPHRLDRIPLARDATRMQSDDVTEGATDRRPVPAANRSRARTGGATAPLASRQWSYDLLDDPRRWLSTAARFRGRIRLASAAPVTGVLLRASRHPDLSTLRRKSLLVPTACHPTARFSMLRNDPPVRLRTTRLFGRGRTPPCPCTRATFAGREGEECSPLGTVHDSGRLQLVHPRAWPI